MCTCSTALVFYPIGKETRRFYSDVCHHPSSLIAVNGNLSDDDSATSHHSNGLLDELTVSIDFPDEGDREAEWPVTALQDERIHLEKNVRFEGNSTWFPSFRDSQRISHAYPSNKSSDHQYYFPPEMPTHWEDEHSCSSSTRYIHAPLFWFHPVLNHDYALCIPSTRPNLHAYQLSPTDPTIRWNLEPIAETSRTRSIRLWCQHFSHWIPNEMKNLISSMNSQHCR